MGLALYFQLGLAALAVFACFFTYARVRASERYCRKSVGEVLEAIGALREQLAVAGALRAELPRAALPAAKAPDDEPRPLAVQVGTEVLELDADIVARIEALREDVNAGRMDGSLLKRVIQAGFDAVEDEAPDSDKRARVLDMNERSLRPRSAAPGSSEKVGSAEDVSGRRRRLYAVVRPPPEDDGPAPITPTKPSRR